MAKHTYTIASEEGAAHYGLEVGAEVELDLSVEEKRAVVAAGWVDPEPEPDETTTKPKGAK